MHPFWARIWNRQTLELLSYLALVVVFAASTLGNHTDESEFHLASNIRDVFVKQEVPFGASRFSKTLSDVSTVDDVWLWLTKVLPPVLYDSGIPCSWCPTGLMDGVLGPNVLVSNGIRIRQLRVLPRSCNRKGHENLANVTRGCYPSFSASDEARLPFGSLQQFRWSQMPATTSQPYRGSVQTWPATGYAVDLGLGGGSSREMAAQVTALKAAHFIDLATRAIIVELALFSPVTRLTSSVRISFEFTAGGSVVAALEMCTVRLWRDLTQRDKLFGYIEQLLGVICVGWLLAYVLRACGKACWDCCNGWTRPNSEQEQSHKGGSSILSDGWRLLHVLTMLVLLLSMALRFLNRSRVTDIDRGEPNPCPAWACSSKARAS